MNNFMPGGPVELFSLICLLESNYCTDNVGALACSLSSGGLPAALSAGEARRRFAESLLKLDDVELRDRYQQILSEVAGSILQSLSEDADANFVGEQLQVRSSRPLTESQIAQIRKTAEYWLTPGE
jgi:hypothetical protein